MNFRTSLSTRKKRKVYSKDQYRRIRFPSGHNSLASQLADFGEECEYAYKIRDTGEIVFVVMTMREREQRESHGFITLPDGSEARYSPIEHTMAEEGVPESVRSMARSKATWPMRTTLTGVGEHQVDELREFIAERKLRGINVLKDGSLEVAGPRAWKEYCEATGLYARNGGYSDPQAKYR